jgi:hypothetical protein
MPNSVFPRPGPCGTVRNGAGTRGSLARWLGPLHCADAMARGPRGLFWIRRSGGRPRARSSCGPREYPAGLPAELQEHADGARRPRGSGAVTSVPPRRIRSSNSISRTRIASRSVGRARRIFPSARSPPEARRLPSGPGGLSAPDVCSERLGRLGHAKLGSSLLVSQ